MTKRLDFQMGLGTVPPQAIEVEEAVLGALMVDRDAFDVVSVFLQPEYFYREAHQSIYRCILEVQGKGQPIDILTVSEQLKTKNLIDEVGGYQYIAKLSSTVGAALNIESHAKIIAQKYIRREIIRGSSELCSNMYDETIEIEEAISMFDAIRERSISTSKGDEIHIKKAVADMYDTSILINQGKGLTGIKLGDKQFDDFSGGVMPGDLMIIAGDTSHGKTTKALISASNAADNGHCVGIISYEMSIFQQAARIVAYTEGISSKEIVMGQIVAEQLLRMSTNVSRMTSNDLYLIKPRGNTYPRLRQDIRRMARIYGMKLFVVDYLQLISNNIPSLSKADQVADVANGLKSLADELSVGIILLSQLSRSENKSITKPTLSRLKQSGDIENAADIVMFTYLPFKHGVESDTVNGCYVTVNENAIITIAKGRNIGTTEYMNRFEKVIPAFYDYSSAEPTDPDQRIEGGSYKPPF